MFVFFKAIGFEFLIKFTEGWNGLAWIPRDMHRVSIHGGDDALWKTEMEEA